MLLVAASWAFNVNEKGHQATSVFIRDDDAGTWRHSLLLEGPRAMRFDGGPPRTVRRVPRDMAVYRDPVTGIDRLFLLVGDLGIISGAYDAAAGRIAWDDAPEYPAGGGALKTRPLGIAAANGRLLASTTDGRIVCYGPKAIANPPVTSSPPAASPYKADKPDSPAAATARRIIEQTGKKAGYCVVLGAGDGRLLYHLASQSDLEVYCIEPDAERAATVRRALDAAGLYGVRVTVHQGTLATLKYPNYMADLLVICQPGSGDLANWPAAEVRRVLRPCGGTVHVVVAGLAGGAEAVKEWLAGGKVPQGEIRNVDGAVQVVRGKLPGAANWTHQYATAARPGASTDQRVKLPFRLLWFGKPGPARLIARHWQGPAPLCVDGRLFVIGQYSLMAVDAYNGRQLWRRDLPSVGRYPVRPKGSNVAADARSVYIATGRECLRLRAATGKTTATYQLPAPPANLPKDAAKKYIWSYLAIGDKGVLGSAGNDVEG
ncbi:MAG: PQQ-binding-like beta-propeller repeat protein, partial [Planctomycetota bacterium]|nr:PQQ-binding-like beta-propeller repeat protein [Planctomycetota bacterium]